MNPSIILKTVARWAASSMFLFSLFLYYRGHNAPGGGFIAGLMACGGMVLVLYAYGKKELQRWLVFSPASWVIVGLSCAYLSALWGLVISGSFFKGIWIQVPLLEKIGTPMLFDFGVMAVVIGMFTKILLAVGVKGEKQ